MPNLRIDLVISNKEEKLKKGGEEENSSFGKSCRNLPERHPLQL